MTIITTQRLIIRHFKEEDAAALFNYLSSPRTPCFKDEKLHSLAEAEVDVAKRASDPTQFAVCLKETDTLIGHLFADNSNEPDNNTWSVGWHFNQRFEHQGYASESVAALFDYLFKVKGARRLYAGWKIIITPLKNYASDYLCDVKDVLKNLSPLKTRRVRQGMTTHTSMRYCIKNGRSRGRRKMSAPRSWRTFGSVNSSRRARSGSRLLPCISIYGKQISQARDIYY